MNKIIVTKLSLLTNLNEPNYKIKCPVCETVMPCKISTCLAGFGSIIWVCSNELCINMGMFMLMNGRMPSNSESV